MMSAIQPGASATPGLPDVALHVGPLLNLLDLPAVIPYKG